MVSSRHPPHPLAGIARLHSLIQSHLQESGFAITEPVACLSIDQAPKLIEIIEFQCCSSLFLVDDLVRQDVIGNIKNTAGEWMFWRLRD